MEPISCGFITESFKTHLRVWRADKYLPTTSLDVGKALSEEHAILNA